MKELLIAFATCAISFAAIGQPLDSQREDRDMEHRALVQRAMEQRDRGQGEMDRHGMEHSRRDLGGVEEHPRRHKVWVPAHREDDGRRVRGRYDWR